MVNSGEKSTGSGPEFANNGIAESWFKSQRLPRDVNKLKSIEHFIQQLEEAVAK